MNTADLLLTQNIGTGGTIEFAEKAVNIKRGSIIVGNNSNVPIALDIPVVTTPNTAILFVGPNSNSGLEWKHFTEGETIHKQNTDIGTNSGSFFMGGNNAADPASAVLSRLLNSGTANRVRLFDNAGSPTIPLEVNSVVLHKTAPTINAEAASKWYVDSELSAHLASMDAFVLKGVIDSGGLIQQARAPIVNGTEFDALVNYSAGWTFKVGAPVNIAGLGALETGDTVLCTNDNAAYNVNHFYVMQSDIKDAITKASFSSTYSVLATNAVVSDPQVISATANTVFMRAGAIMQFGTIIAEMISANAVIETKIATNGVATRQIQPNAVTEAKIANDAVNTRQILNNAVVTNKVANAAITYAKIENLGAYGIFGRNANDAGVGASINATEHGVLMRNTTNGLIFQQISNAEISANAAIALSKLASITAARLIGRTNAASGAPTEISLGAGLEMNGTVLQVNEAAVNPTETDPVFSNWVNTARVAKTVYAGPPSGGNAAATFRQLTWGDVNVFSTTPNANTVNYGQPGDIAYNNATKMLYICLSNNSTHGVWGRTALATIW